MKDEFMGYPDRAGKIALWQSRFILHPSSFILRCGSPAARVAWGRPSEVAAMVGPVVHQELLLGGRRNRMYVLRWIYAGWLVTQVCFLYLAFLAEEQARYFRANVGRPWGAQQQVAESYLSAPEVVG